MERAEADWRDLLAGFDLTSVAPAGPPAEKGDPADIIENAARRAGLCEFLAEAARADEPLLVAVNDTHRFTDSRSAVEAVCRIAEAERLPLRMRLLVAAGSHTFDDPAEKAEHERRIVGERATVFVERDWHDAQDANRLRPAGGVRVHRWVAECRRALAVGSMEPHYFAGVTGAHKTLSVGVLAIEDIARNHIAALSDQANGLALRGNPIYDGLATIVRALEAEGRRFFALNEILSGGRVVFCSAGEPLDSVEASLPRVRETFGATIERAVDFAVSIVRPPLDRDLYQADKGIKNVENVVRDGGAIVLEAACAGGVGIDRFFRMLDRAPTRAEALAWIEREGYVLGDHKAVRLRALTERGVALAAVAPGLAAEAAAVAGIESLPDRAAASEWLRTRMGAGARGVIVEDAGNVTLVRG